MTKKTDITSAERIEFRQAMTNVHTAFDQQQTTTSILLNKPSHVKTIHTSSATHRLVDPEGYFHDSGLQKGVLRQLRSGQFFIDAHVDLHGYSLDDAQIHMEAFLGKAEQHRWRMIHVIHGKGLGSEYRVGKIKQWLFIWLQEQPGILAWQAASRHHGGKGAGYCLLRKKHQ
jgi:DNA-nicking Smr family endonuclease